MRWLIAALAAMALLSSCGERRASVPRPRAWARITPYPATYHPLEGAPRHFVVNDSTVMVADSAGWFTLRYPRYDAVVYLTFTPVSAATMAQVIDNRTERMALNAGAGRSELTELRSAGGYEVRMMRTPSGTVTPLQFLAMRDDMVVTGAAFIPSAATAASPDSLTPVLDAIEGDFLTALKALE